MTTTLSKSTNNIKYIRPRKRCLSGADNYYFVTNNIIVNQAIIYIAAALFLISVFPIHVFNYIYVNSEDKFASVNVTIFRFIKLYNINTVKDVPNEIQINGKSKKMSPNGFRLNFYRIFNKVCIYKVIQLSDYGMRNQSNVYAALAQNAVTTALYKFIQVNGNYSKLKNYTVLNEEHASIRYYAKAVTIINLLVLLKILFIILMEKTNAFEN